MKRIAISFFVQVLFLNYAFAGTQIQHAVYPPHSGRSPLAFDKISTPSDTFIVADRGADNDNYRYRDDSAEYDFTFELPIERYVGDVQKLKSNKLISQTVKVYIPAFDVDPSDGEKDCDNDGILDTMRPEVDEVYFNGEKIGVLSGGNNVWDIAGNTFEIPIEKVNLPSTPGEVTTNTVQIKIDAENKNVTLSSGQTGCQMWATEIDYVALEFDVVDPVALVTGLGGLPGAFESAEYIETLADKYGVPAFIVPHTPTVPQRSCAQTDATSFPIHGGEVIQKLQEKSNEFKTNKFNIIAHSKGGLDSRYAANRLASEAVLTSVGSQDGTPVYNPIYIHSLTMLGTPNAGTVIADALYYNQYLGRLVDPFASYVKELRDYCDLSPAKVSRFTSTTPLPSDIKVLLIGGNADEDGDGQLNDREAEHNQIPTTWASNRAFEVTGSGQRIAVVMVDRILNIQGTTYATKVPEIQLISSDAIAPNDTLVRVDSVLSIHSDKSLATVGNHKTIIFEQNAGKPWSGAKDITINEGLTGVLKWGSK